MFGYQVAGVTNPWNDLTSGLGYGSPTTGSLTINQANPQNIQHTAGVQGCALGGILLAIGAGAIAGIATGGLAAVPVGLLVGGVVGCGAGGYIGNQFPAGTSQLFNSIISSTGPIGTFLQGITAALQYVYPFVQFVTDLVPYDFALASYEPAFGAMLGLIISMTLLWWILTLAEIWRGQGAVG